LVPALATHTAAGEVISPSHQRVKCPLCGDELRRESLAKHCASKHQDVLCVEEKKRAASPTPAEKSGVANLFARAAAKKARLSGVAAASEGAAVAGSANAARDDAPGAAQPGAALAGPVSGFPAQQVSERLTTLQYTALLKELAAARTELGALRAQVTKPRPCGDAAQARGTKVAVFMNCIHTGASAVTLASRRRASSAAEGGRRALKAAGQTIIFCNSESWGECAFSDIKEGVPINGQARRQQRWRCPAAAAAAAAAACAATT